MSELDNESDIAIIGMAGRFPGAEDIDQLWSNLCNKSDVRQTFTDQQLKDLHLNQEKTSANDYVRKGYCLKNVDQFAADFFDITPRQAKTMDPQQRIFLETVWHGLEHAGYVPDQCPGQVGVFAGSNFNSYIFNVADNMDMRDTDIYLEAMIANDKDYLSSRVSHKLNFTGPSVTVQTSCSSSLAAIATACQSLLDYQCDMAISGGSGLNIPQERGYRYFSEGGLSKDAACHAFDENSTGVVHGNGVGVVVLKRLEDALADKDNVIAIIKGWAMNNDGSRKVAYEAPSVEGQVEVIQEALSVANVSAEDIRFIETHGTGTPVGDPIEFRAIQRAFNLDPSGTDENCALSSVKANIGHLGAAAGVAGLIKTALCLKHRQLPPMMHFSAPNPALNIDNSGFYVNTETETLTPLNQNEFLLAGVSSFGIGGTNVHLIVQEYCDNKLNQYSDFLEPKAVINKPIIFPLSAQSQNELAAQKQGLHDYLSKHSNTCLNRLAYSLQQRRKEFSQREFILANDHQSLIQQLEKLKPVRGQNHDGTKVARELAFMYPGSGEQYAGMAEILYQQESVFSEAIDECTEISQPLLQLDIRQVICTDKDDVWAQERMAEPQVMLASMFIVEYALTCLWRSWGVKPDYIIGHSLGEYSAAFQAGVFTLDQGIKLVIRRGQLIKQCDPGKMLIVGMSREKVNEILPHDLSLAAHNGDHLCMVSGLLKPIEQFIQQLTLDNISFQLMPGDRAAHSSTLDSVLAEFLQYFEEMELSAPNIPFLSNVTGQWISPEEATSPEYWVNHFRHTVQFYDGLSQLLSHSDCLLLEVGPGRGLSTIARRHPDCDNNRVILSSLLNRNKQTKDASLMYQSVGALWCHGYDINWQTLSGNKSDYSLALPGYPFERKSYWFERKINPSFAPITKKAVKREDISEWFYGCGWKQKPIVTQTLHDQQLGCCVLFVTDCDFSRQIVSAARSHYAQVVSVSAGTDFTALEDNCYEIRPTHGEDYIQLLNLIDSQKLLHVIHLWGCTSDLSSNRLHYTESIAFTQGYLSLMNLMHSFAHHGLAETESKLSVVSRNIYKVTGDEILNPLLATLCGPCKVIPYEFPHCQLVHVDLGESDIRSPTPALICDVLQQNRAEYSFLPIAYRHGLRWCTDFSPLTPSQIVAEDNSSVLRNEGVYLITGGFGGVGSTAARWIANTVKNPQLYLMSRTALPAENLWDSNDGLDEETINRITLIKELRVAGALVIPVCADASNEDDLVTLAEVIRSQTGQFNGIVHAAGVVGGGLIQLEESAKFRDNLEIKVCGSQRLLQNFANKDLDFIYLCSSLGSLVGSFGQVENTAANSFMDALAHQYQNNSVTQTQVMSINWDYWLGLGMMNQLAERHHQITGETITVGIDGNEGMSCFNLFRKFSVPQLVVSCAELQPLLQQRNQNITQTLSLFEKTNISANGDDDRPDLANKYVAPSSQVENVLIKLWSKRLGIEQIGVEDNFIELGGDSMLALPLMADMRDALQCDLPLRALFSEQNIRAIASYIIQQEPSQGFSEQVATVYLQVSSMDTDQLDSLLKSHTSTISSSERES